MVGGVAEDNQRRRDLHEPESQPRFGPGTSDFRSNVSPFVPTLMLGVCEAS